MVTLTSVWRKDIEFFNIETNLKEHLSGKTVLDLACGTGLYTNIFHTYGASKVVGIDASAEMLKIAEKNKISNSISFEEGFVGSLDKKQKEQIGKFDYVTCFWLFSYAETVKDFENMVADVKSFVKPGGKVLILNENVFLTNYKNYEKYKFTVTASPDDNKIHYHTKDELDLDFRVTNFRMKPEVFVNVMHRYFDKLTIFKMQARQNEIFYQDFLEANPLMLMLCQ